MSYSTKEEILKLGDIDAEFEAVSPCNQSVICSSLRSIQALEKLNLPPADYSDLAWFKKITDDRLRVSLAELGAPPHDIKQTDHQVSIYDGSTVRARVYQPVPPPNEGSPLIVM